MSNGLVVVTGAAGRQGSAVTRELLKRREDTHLEVRALVHRVGNPGADELATLGAEVVQGDFDDRESLERAFDGATTVFSVQDFYSAGAEGEVRQGKNVADVAKASGVEHLVYSSVGSAHRDTGIPHFQTKWQIEEYIREIDIPHTILRPVFFYYNYAGLRESIEAGKLALPLSPDKPLQQLCEHDYGIVVATVMANRASNLGRALDVASSELSMHHTCEIFSHVLGRTVKYEQIPWETAEEQMGHDMTTMFRWFDEHGYEADIEAIRSEFTELTSLDHYLREHGWEHARA